MVQPRNEQLIQKEKIDNPLPPLPFTYTQTIDPQHAQIVVEVDMNKPGTEQEALEKVQKEKELEKWYTSREWREKGIPLEQVEVLVGEHPITIYNYNPKTPLTDQHLKELEDVFKQVASRFPQTLPFLRWILIDDEVIEGYLGEPVKGHALSHWNAFRLLPAGMTLDPYRIPTVSNLKGTATHELQHINQAAYREEWQSKFQWYNCADYPDDWELRSREDNDRPYYKNKHTGEIALSQFTSLPQQCVNEYARIINWAEDRCESIVAYIYNPALLKDKSPEKFEVLQNHDATKPLPEVSIRRIPPNEIKLPEVQPEIIHYLVKPAKFKFNIVRDMNEKS